MAVMINGLGLYNEGITKLLNKSHSLALYKDSQFTN
jgi:hypothetical protein